MRHIHVPNHIRTGPPKIAYLYGGGQTKLVPERPPASSYGWRKQNRPQRIKLNFKRPVNAELTLPTAELASRKRERGRATLHWGWDWPEDRGVGMG